MLSLLLNKLENETLDEVIKELVYALGSQLRGYVEEIKSFNEKDGTTILLNVYVKVTDKPRIKILILLADLSNPDMNSGESETLGFTDEKLRPWCVLVLEEMKRSKMVGPDAYEFALALHKRPNCCKPPLVLLPFKKKFEDDY